MESVTPCHATQVIILSHSYMKLPGNITISLQTVLYHLKNEVEQSLNRSVPKAWQYTKFLGAQNGQHLFDMAH